MGGERPAGSPPPLNLWCFRCLLDLGIWLWRVVGVFSGLRFYFMERVFLIISSGVGVSKKDGD